MGKLFSVMGVRLCDGCGAHPQDYDQLHFGSKFVLGGIAYYLCPDCRETAKEIKAWRVDRDLDFEFEVGDEVREIMHDGHAVVVEQQRDYVKKHYLVEFDSGMELSYSEDNLEKWKDERNKGVAYPTVEVTRGGYGFAHNWTLRIDQDTSFWLGQDVKFCKRVLACNMKWLADQVKERIDKPRDYKIYLGFERDSHALAEVILDRLEEMGCDIDNISSLQPWELAGQ